jgi:hypothetical protein
MVVVPIEPLLTCLIQVMRFGRMSMSGRGEAFGAPQWLLWPA